MKLPKYINLYDTPVNEKKHAGQLNYQRVNDLLSEFEAVEIGEIIAAGFIYEIYGIELDLADDETREMFPHLQDRACRTQYRQLLTDFDVNGKSYDDRIEKNRRAANIRWHGKGGKVKAEKAKEDIQEDEDSEGMTESELRAFLSDITTRESKETLVPEDDDEGMTEEEWNEFIRVQAGSESEKEMDDEEYCAWLRDNSARRIRVNMTEAQTDMTEAQLRSFLLQAKRYCMSFDEYRGYVLTSLSNGEITIKDKIRLLELGRKGEFEK